ncbi:MAG: response regulator [Syntrophales bacterium]|nr:response regulator [Syntrophales bacterium]
MAKVLVVDDEKDFCDAMTVVLTRRGYRVECVSNGEEALRHLRDNPVDIVLLDIMMPVMDGFETCRRIKGDERLRNIPVILITALGEKKDRITGFEAGADDFISKPIDQGEVLARIQSLLKLKEARDLHAQAYDALKGLISFGMDIFDRFSSIEFDPEAKIEDVVRRIIRRTVDMVHRPEKIIIGELTETGRRKWCSYEWSFHEIQKIEMETAGQADWEKFWHRPERPEKGYVNEEDLEKPELAPVVDFFHLHGIKCSNFVFYERGQTVVLGLNYGRRVQPHDADVLMGMVAMDTYLRSLAGQMRETEEAFHYLIMALARASEANDEDTGQHILRVGEYCGLIAQRLGLSDHFIRLIREQAPLHDVGKVYVSETILKKPGPLTEGEMTAMKLHTVYGAKIIGNHPRLEIGRTIALTHHERWDGTGYPQGLKGEEIPIAGRIAILADQYDALRNKRIYKPAFDHERTCEIILKGDGRTLPQHFDPHVLNVFRREHKAFAEIYDRLSD